MLNNILLDIDSFDLREFPTVEEVLKHLTNSERRELLEILRDLRTDALYSGLVHGLYHSEKVFMFTYLLVKKRNIQEPYRQILFDAALYHDIGREDNREESLHGMVSARKISKLVKDNPLYENKANLLLLKAIIDAHSQKDAAELECYKNNAYDLDLLDNDFNLTPELEKLSVIFLELARILKDADALDRKRFGDAGFESLNPRYLRYPESHSLIRFAEELNAFYYELIKANYLDVDEKDIEEAPCVHSVGFDFFKINSVLTHGILSQDEMKKRQMKIARNFSGGNFDRWISVVDIRLLKLHATASQEFIEHGVAFVCGKVKMHKPSPMRDMEDAIVTGMPWNKSNHDDERYVKNRIAPENILAVNIPRNYIHKSILDTDRIGDEEHDSCRMIYIYNSLDIKMIRQRVKYYKEKTKTSDDSPLWLTILKMLDTYEQIIVNRDVYGRGKIAAELNPILDIINNRIGRMLYAYYYQLIGSAGRDITVLDVVTYELSQNYSIKYNYCETPDGGTFFLISSPKSIEAKQI